MIVALIDAIFIGLGIYFLNVPMAVPFAVFIFLFAFIPLVGAVMSGALAVVVAVVTQGVFTALMTLLVVLAVQQIEGHILQPFILGRAVRVHPLAVVLSVAAGGLVAGIGGAVVAVPLVAVTNTVVGYLRSYSREPALRHAPGAARRHRGGCGPGASPVSVTIPPLRRGLRPASPARRIRSAAGPVSGRAVARAPESLGRRGGAPCPGHGNCAPSPSSAAEELTRAAGGGAGVKRRGPAHPGRVNGAWREAEVAPRERLRRPASWRPPGSRKRS